MLPLLAAALLVQDSPPEPPTPPEARAVPGAYGDLYKLFRNSQIRLPNADGNDRVRLVGLPAGDLFGDTTQPAVPTTGTLKLTAPDGTVTEYRAEFTPDPPAASEPPAKARLGVALENFTPQGDPPGLVIFKVVKDSAAAKAGLKDGDRLISVGDEPLKSFQVLRLKVAEAAGGEKPLAVKVVREEGDDGGEPKAVKILRFQLKPAELKLEEDGPVVRLADEIAAGRLVADQFRFEIGELPAAFGKGFSFGPATVRPADAAAMRADLDAAKAVLEQARVDLDRKKRLSEQGLVSEAKMGQARVALLKAQAELAAAKAGERRDDLADLRGELAALRAELDALKAARDAGSDDE